MGTVGENIKKILNNRGLSVNAAAKKYQMSQTTLNELVSGKTVRPQMPTLQKVAQGLGVSVDELIREESGGHHSEGVAERVTTFGDADPLSGFVLIPRYNVEASAGGGAVVSEEQVIDRLAFKEV